MNKPLSANMIDLIELMREHGREFVRYQGGYWSARHTARQSHNGRPVWSVGTGTVNALVVRGYATYTEYVDGRKGRFPIAVRLSNVVSA